MLRRAFLSLPFVSLFVKKITFKGFDIPVEEYTPLMAECNSLTGNYFYKAVFERNEFGMLGMKEEYRFGKEVSGGEHIQTPFIFRTTEH